MHALIIPLNIYFGTQPLKCWILICATVMKATVHFSIPGCKMVQLVLCSFSMLFICKRLMGSLSKHISKVITPQMLQENEPLLRSDLWICSVDMVQVMLLHFFSQSTQSLRRNKEAWLTASGKGISATIFSKKDMVVESSRLTTLRWYSATRTWLFTTVTGWVGK